MDKEALNFMDSAWFFFLCGCNLTRSECHLTNIWLVGVIVRKCLGSINITDNVILLAPAHFLLLTVRTIRMSQWKCVTLFMLQ